MQERKDSPTIQIPKGFINLFRNGASCDIKKRKQIWTDIREIVNIHISQNITQLNIKSKIINDLPNIKIIRSLLVC